MNNLSVSLSAKKFVIDNVDNIIQISKPLKQATNIELMMYTKYFDDGTSVDLTTKKEWVNHYYSTYFVQKEMEFISNRVKAGVNYWRRNQNDTVSEVREDARDNFNIDARLDFIYRDEFNKCFHAYSFCADKKHADKAYSFYGNQIAKLLKFIPYFQSKVQNLIFEGSKPGNRIIIPNYKPISLKKAIAHRNLSEELRQENASFEPTCREFEVLLLYAHGVSKAQIGEMLNKSINTVMTHLQHIRNKSHLTDRFSMLMYLKDRGEDVCINFFFPYVPRNAA